MFRKYVAWIGFAVFLLAVAVMCEQADDHNADLETYALCEKILDENAPEVLRLMQVYQGQFVEKGNDGFNGFAALFDHRLSYVDLRDPNMVVFSFRDLRPEGCTKLIYQLDDRLWIQADTYHEADTNELRVDHLGINQSGYIFSKRIRQGWFYYEAYLPT